jgi:hypothetical protein
MITRIKINKDRDEKIIEIVFYFNKLCMLNLKIRVIFMLFLKNFNNY